MQAIENSINGEREKLLQLIALADEYEQTLKDFAQITDVAEALVDSPIVVHNLQHLQVNLLDNLGSFSWYSCHYFTS